MWAITEAGLDLKHASMRTGNDGNKLRIRRRTARMSTTKPLGMILLLVMLMFAITKCSQLC